MQSIGCHLQQLYSTLQVINIKVVIFVNKPLVEPTARVPPSDMKSTEVKGDSAVITFTDLNKNKERIQYNNLIMS